MNSNWRVVSHISHVLNITMFSQSECKHSWSGMKIKLITAISSGITDWYSKTSTSCASGNDIMWKAERWPTNRPVFASFLTSLICCSCHFVEDRWQTQLKIQLNEVKGSYGTWIQQQVNAQSFASVLNTVRQPAAWHSGTAERKLKETIIYEPKTCAIFRALLRNEVWNINKLQKTQ